MGIRRAFVAATDHFTHLPNEWVRDERLSYKARGVLAVLVSHREGWQTSMAQLIAGGREGREAVQGAVAELEALGYLRRERVQGEGGRFAGMDYVIGEDEGPPEGVGKPSVGKPSDGKPSDGSPASKKTTLLEDQGSAEDHTPPAPAGEARPSAAELGAEWFEAWWAIYPRKVGKVAARTAYVRAAKTAGPAVVIDGLQRALPLLRQTETRFVPYPASWLNAGRWEDEAPAQQPRQAPRREQWRDR